MRDVDDDDVGADAAKLRGTFEEVGPSEASPTSQVQYIQTAAQQGAGGLIVSANDPEAMGLWKEFRDTSLDGFRKVYARLGIHFEHYEGESRYQGKMDAVIDEILNVGASIGVTAISYPIASDLSMPCFSAGQATWSSSLS